MTRRILNYFFNGLIIVLPLFLIVVVVYRLFTFLNQLVPMDEYFKGAGVVVILVGITLIGFLGSTLIARPIKRWFNQLIEGIPLVKTFYSAIRDLLSAFVGKKKRFNKPVLVKLNDKSNMHKLGFITDDDLDLLGGIEGMVAVYLPHSYNFSGNLFIVESKHVKKVDQNAADVMKYIVSGGVSEIVEVDEDED